MKALTADRPISILLIGSAEKTSRLQDVFASYLQATVESCADIADAERILKNLQFQTVVCVADGSDLLQKLETLPEDVACIALVPPHLQISKREDFAAAPEVLLLPEDVSAELLRRAVQQCSIAKQLELTLRENEDRFRSVFDEGPLGIYLVTLYDLRIVQANQAFCQLLDYDESELQGRTVYDITFPADLPQTIEMANSLLQKRTDRMEKRYLRKDGEPVWVNVTATVVRDRHGEPLHRVAMVEDISERKRLEQTMRESIGLEQREDFMATLTHDLKTPLVGSNMVLGALLDGTLGPLHDEQREILTKLKASNHALLKMIQNLLEVYRYEAGSEALLLKRVDLIPLLDFTVDEVRPLLDSKEQELVVNLPKGALSVIGDEDAIKRVFINILSNAVKFTPEHGTIKIEAEKRDPVIAVEFKDTGIGISDEDRERLFQRFWQGGSHKRYAVGTGLGLYFCQRVVAAHKGSIDCHSEIGSGTTFTVTLPAVME